MRSPSTPAKALIAVLLLCLLAGNAFAFSSGPPNGLTGAPLQTGGTEGNCTQCHTGSPLNSGGGSVTIIAPSSYMPGEILEIMVAVEQQGQQRWGFELTVVDENLGFAGDLLPVDANTQTSFAVALQREYIKHTLAGTNNGQQDANVFTFDWEAPAEDVGDVTFYAAGNAANGANGNQGDFIYTTSITLPEPGAGMAGAAGVLALACIARWRART